MTAQGFPHRAKGNGFSVLELVVIVAILIALAGVATPYLLDVIENAKTSKILEIHAKVSSAVSEYRNDVMKANPSFTPTDPLLLPREDAPGGVHQLYYLPNDSTGSPLEGWNGPYLTKPLDKTDNPFGGEVILEPDLSDADYFSSATPWKLLGSADPGIGGAGSFLVFSGLPLTTAMAVDDALDGGVQGTGGFGSQASDWNSVGRVQYVATAPGGLADCLYLFILDLDGQ